MRTRRRCSSAKPLVEPRHVFLDVDVRVDGGDRRADLGELPSVERGSGGFEVCNRARRFHKRASPSRPSQEPPHSRSSKSAPPPRGRRTNT